MLEGIITWLQAMLKSGLIWLLKGISLGLWYVEKAAAWVSEQVITSTIWETIIEGILDSLADALPDTLSSVMFGSGIVYGFGGLFYIAMIGVSLMLVVPHLLRNGQQPVRFERVLGWSMLVIVMFISSTVGYDAIGNIERMRMQTINGIASAWGAGSVTDFVAVPMSATVGEINVDQFTLPAAFEDEYFPDPTAYEVIEIVFFDAPIIGENSATVTVETDDSLAFRITQASLGIVLAIVNLVPTVLVVILALSFAALTASALVLILFFILAIPVGLFEIGGALLSQIASRYVVVWALSIFVAMFPAMLLGVAELTLTPPVTLPDLFTYIAVLLVAVVAVQHIAKWVFQVATDIFAGIGQTMNTVLMPQMYGGYVGATPTPNQLPPYYAMGAMGGAAMAGVAPGVAASQAGNIASQMVYSGAAAIGGAAGLGIAFAAERWSRSTETQHPSPVTAIQTVGSSQPQPPTHVFAYLDDPNIIEGEFEVIEEKAPSSPADSPTIYIEEGKIIEEGEEDEA